MRPQSPANRAGGPVAGAHDGIFVLLPMFATPALAFGIINGLIAAHLLSEKPSGENNQNTQAC